VTYDNTNSGVLFKNDKGDNPKRPDYRGSLNVGGAEYNISGWIRKSKKTGDSFMSLKIEAKKNFSGLKKADPVVQKPMTEDNWADLDEPF